MFELTTIDIFIRLALAAVLGMTLGMERSIAGKSAGMRTFALVSLSSAVFVTMGMIIDNAYIGRVNFDPVRTMAAVVVGIGFIGAGAIMFKSNILRGLTTAAGLWIAAGVGAASAFGFYSIAVFATLLTILIFTGVWFIEKKLKAIKTNNEPTVVDKLTTQEEEIDE